MWDPRTERFFQDLPGDGDEKAAPARALHPSAEAAAGAAPLDPYAPPRRFYDQDEPTIDWRAREIEIQRHRAEHDAFDEHDTRADVAAIAIAFVALVSGLVVFVPWTRGPIASIAAIGVIAAGLLVARGWLDAYERRHADSSLVQTLRRYGL